MKIRKSVAFIRGERVGRFILLGILIAVFLVGASLFRFSQVASPAPGEQHSDQVAAGTSGPPAMSMPATSDEGALGQDLAAASIRSSDVLSLSLISEESGFYDVDAILASQDDPTSARARYMAEGLSGGYLQVFRGTGGIREVQSSILAFRSPAGATQELEFWRTDTVGADDVAMLQPPSGDGSFAVSFTTDVDGETLVGALMAWANGSRVYGIFVAAQDLSQAETLATELAGIMDKRG
jgi:hypothetical protein